MSAALAHELEKARLTRELAQEAQGPAAQRGLATKTLEVLLVNKFVYEYGFQNGRLVAERIVQDILETVETYWVPAAQAQAPGSFRALAVDRHAVPGPYSERLEETPHVPVSLRLLTEDERARLAAREVTPARLRRERALRFFFEAEEQGGLLTAIDVAWFVGASPSTVSRWVREHQETTGEVVPTRGTLHDLGPGVTHKRLIVRLFLEGKLPSEIARATRHAQKNVDRYIAAYERVRLLARSHPREEIPPLANMAPSLVEEYLQLLEEFEGVRPAAPRPTSPPEGTTSTPSEDEVAAQSGAHASRES